MWQICGVKWGEIAAEVAGRGKERSSWQNCFGKWKWPPANHLAGRGRLACDRQASIRRPDGAHPAYVWNTFGIRMEYIAGPPRNGASGRSDQSLFLFRGADEISEKRVRSEGLRLQFRVELDADEPGMVLDLDDLGQAAVGRHAREYQAAFL